MIKTLFTLIVLIQIAAPLARAGNIFGSDKRVTADVTQFPFNRIGSLLMIRKADAAVLGFCTASLVGPNIILTNSHCTTHAYDAGTVLVFAPGFDENHQPAASPVVAVSEYRQLPPQSDWALAELRDPLGDRFGWFEIGDTKDYLYFNRWRFPMSVTMAGYSSDWFGGTKMAVENNCQIHKETDDGLLFHDCATWTGGSGSPIFTVKGDKAYIVALNEGAIVPGPFRYPGAPNPILGAFSEDLPNLAVNAKAFSHLIWLTKRPASKRK